MLNDLSRQTLRAAIDWSYNLLSESEQTGFARLGVFVGGCTLAAAAAICNPHDDAEPHTGGDLSTDSKQALSFDVQEGIASLLDKNLIKREEGVAVPSELEKETEGESRFSMLELIREYALERLRASGKEEDIRGLHAEYYLAFAEVADVELRRANPRPWLDKLGQEHDNIRAALRWLLNSGNATLAVQLTGAMHTFWFQRGHYSEGRRWLMETLAACDEMNWRSQEAVPTFTPTPIIIRARALGALGGLAQQEDDHKEATGWLEESLALYREAGDKAGIAGILRSLAFSAMNLGDQERAIALGREGLALGFDPALRYETIRLLNGIGSAALFQGDFVQAEEFIAEVVALSREEGAKEGLAAGLNALGLIAHYQGEYSKAQVFYDESLSIARLFGYQHHVHHIVSNMADLALLQGDHLRAAPLMIEGFRVAVEIGSKSGIAEGLEGMAYLVGIKGQPERAARLFGAAEALREAASIPVPLFARATDEHNVSAVRAKMDEEVFAKGWIEGRAMSVEQAVDYALEEI